MLEKFNSPGRAGLAGWRWTVGWSPLRKFGFEKTTVWGGQDTPYLTRWVMYLGWGTLRLHKFWRGDDDSLGPHTHPWWFVTIPLRSYCEWAFEKGARKHMNLVQAFRPHFRKASHEHIVVGPVHKTGPKSWSIDYPAKPFYTIVISGGRAARWGFYPKPGEFVYWRDAVNHIGERKQ